MIETIDLEKTYVSSFDEKYTLQDIIESKDCNYPGKLLKDSIYVKFIKEFKDKNAITDYEIKESKYYRAFRNRIQTYGSFNGKKDDVSLMLYCHNFIDLYQHIKSKPSNFDVFRRFLAAIKHSGGGYPLAFKILNSDYYMLYDGHHRASCQYVLGQKFIKAKMMGVRKNNLQSLQYEEDIII